MMRGFLGKVKKKLYLFVAGYFRLFANIVLKVWRPRILVITGSAGKTTMLNLLELQIGERAHYSHNANSAFGISFDILGIDGIRGSKMKWFYLFLVAPFRTVVEVVRNREKLKREFYIVEIDGERPHEAEWLGRWLKPEVVMWVSVGDSHAVQFEEVVKQGKFKNVSEAIIYEFGSLARSAKKLVIVRDQEEMVQEVIRDRGEDCAKVVKVNENGILEYKVTTNETIFKTKQNRFRFNHPEPEEVGVQILIMEEILKYLGLELREDLGEMRMAPGRSSVFEGVKGTTLIDSTYNAHMISMEGMLKMMKKIKAEKKWLVLSDIVEQGKLEGEEHKRLAEMIFEVGADRVILVGRRMGKWTEPELRKILQDSGRLGAGKKSNKGKVSNIERGNENKVKWFENVKEAREFIIENISGGEVILFKGSQYLEWLVEQMLADDSNVVKLARREAGAVRRRKKWGLR